MNIYKFFLFISCFILVVFINSCAGSKTSSGTSAGSGDTTSVKYVLPDDYENFILSWGYNDSSADKIMGYSLKPNGKIEFWQQNKNTKKIKSDSLATINNKRLEEILKYTNNAYLYTPALNEPGKYCGFIELKKPKVNFYSKATWNEHNTYGSRLFRNLFDTLMTLIPIEIFK